jgi:hypothetical protein
VAYLAGVDVSAHQSATPDLRPFRFLFARATYGHFADRLYAMHIANAKAAGLVVGAYHFGRSGSVDPIGGQVDAFLARVGSSTRLLFLDMEADGSNPAMSHAEGVDFVNRIHARGLRIGLYHSQSGFGDVGQDWNDVAKWSTTPPTIPWTFWQYQGSPLDLDYYRGTLAQLHELAQLEVAPPMGLALGRSELRPARITLAADADVRLARVADGKLVDPPDGATFRAFGRATLVDPSDPSKLRPLTGGDADNVTVWEVEYQGQRHVALARNVAAVDPFPW